jgi:hypothetical protein
LQYIIGRRKYIFAFILTTPHDEAILALVRLVLGSFMLHLFVFSISNTSSTRRMM